LDPTDAAGVTGRGIVDARLDDRKAARSLDESDVHAEPVKPPPRRIVVDTVTQSNKAVDISKPERNAAPRHGGSLRRESRSFIPVADPGRSYVTDTPFTFSPSR
jgi:hypothetical protein